MHRPKRSISTVLIINSSQGYKDKLFSTLLIINSTILLLCTFFFDVKKEKSYPIAC